MIYVDGKTLSVHRYSYQIHLGEIPEGALVCHRCDNPRCINPDHLFLGNHTENMADRMAKDRQAKGSRMGGAKLTEENVLEIRATFKKGRGQKNGQYFADLYGVSKNTIWKIINRTKWQHI